MDYFPVLGFLGISLDSVVQTMHAVCHGHGLPSRCAVAQKSLDNTVLGYYLGYTLGYGIHGCIQGVRWGLDPLLENFFTWESFLRKIISLLKNFLTVFRSSTFLVNDSCTI